MKIMCKFWGGILICSSPVSLSLHEKPIIDVLTNKVIGFDTEGFILKISRQYAWEEELMYRAAEELNLKSRLIQLGEKQVFDGTYVGVSEHSVMLPMEIDSNSKGQ